MVYLLLLVESSALFAYVDNITHPLSWTICAIFVFVIITSFSTSLIRFSEGEMESAEDGTRTYREEEDEDFGNDSKDIRDQLAKQAKIESVSVDTPSNNNNNNINSQVSLADRKNASAVETQVLMSLW